MTSTVEPLERHRDRRLLAGAVDALARERAAQVDLLVAAADWADAHPVGEGEAAASHGGSGAYGEQAVSLAGPGAPLMSEFAAFEFAAALGWTPERTRALIADAIELRHRLPRLWDLTVSDRLVPVHVARHIARHTLDLTKDAANQADRAVAGEPPSRIAKARALRLVDEVRLWFDPDRAVDDEQHALAARGAWTYPTGTPAVAEMQLLLDQDDADRFDHALSEVAARLKALGDADPLDVRRAKAAGVLADPRAALDLLTGEAREHGARTGPATKLYLHLSDESLLDRVEGAGGPVTIERLGTVTQALIEEWLTGARVVVRPVLHLAGDAAAAPPSVDRHDAPDAMREAVVLRDATCVYPGCTRDSRACDLDHIEAFIDPGDGGPPGQTGLANLAPLCRRHHRAKTHGGFTYRRLPDGSYRWTLPSGLSRIVVR